tara:strand:+ start:26178 stop:27191 length:1014 start_codon:yes stop_codon:yes gene_type:complete
MSRESTFYQLFKGYPEAYGTNEGGCKWESVNLDLIRGHLYGSTMIGSYPMVYDPHCKLDLLGPLAHDTERKYANMQKHMWHCRWGAIDIDEGDDSLDYAFNAKTILQAIDVPSWVELSRSKGCHVWVFCEDFVEASLMRKVLKAAMQLGDIPYDAVYPKQDHLDGPVGNYMRLPYGKDRPIGRQTMLTDEGGTIELDQFLYEAEENKARIVALEAASTLYKEPVSTLPPLRDYSKEPLMTIDGSKLRGLAKQMYEEGPVAYYRTGEGAGRGRHGFLNRFARAMWEANYSKSDIVSWTSDLDSRLGSWYEEGPKFSGRKDGSKQIQHLVEKAQRQARR